MSNQTNLSVMLDGIEKRYFRTLDEPDDDAYEEALTDNPRLVKALRHQRERLLFELNLIVPESSTKHGAIEQLMFETDAEITAILQASSEPKGEKN